MAIAYHRMTPSMLTFLLDISEEESKDILLNRLKRLSFIKYKPGDVVLLHDEMRRLMIEIWWESHDSGRILRKAIVQRIIRYYQERLLKNCSEEQAVVYTSELEIYTAELNEHTLWVEPLVGLDLFRDEFDQTLESGRYDHAGHLLSVVENYFSAHPNDIPYPHYLKIKSRQIRYYTETDKNYQRSIEMGEALLREHEGKPGWENNVERGYILFSMGIAYIWSGKFDTAIRLFKDAKKIFFNEGEDIFLYRADNWIGLAYSRQGTFDEASSYWTGALKGFYTLLDRAMLSSKHQPQKKRELRRLIQGIQHAFGNFAVLYRHTHRSEIAIRYAEIQLNIVRQLSRNNKEIARARITVNHTMTYAGHSVDARHHAAEAERILEQHQIADRLLRGRLKTNQSLLTYRSNELSYILEYYRAEEIERIVAENLFVGEKEKEEALRLVNEAIEILNRSPQITKELADAYYVLGELYMLMSLPEHWKLAESALETAFKLSEQIGFRYRLVDTAESLVTLYYFWNGATEVDEASKRKNLEKIVFYSDKITLSDYKAYPSLAGKYEITLGDIAFDQALTIQGTGAVAIHQAIKSLKEAFEHYVKAAGLLKDFSELYHLALRIFYNRLNTLLEKQRNQKPLEPVIGRLDELRNIWTREQLPVFERLYQYVLLQRASEQNQEKLRELEKELDKARNVGDFGLALLLNDCLIGISEASFANGQRDDALQERIIRQLNEQVRFYRILRDEYHAEEYSRHARNFLKNHLSDPILAQALDGYIGWNEGATMYRRGEYGRLLEIYLQDELEIAWNKFEQQYPNMGSGALETLKRAEKNLYEAISAWQHSLATASTVEEQALLKEYIQRYQKEMGETKFRLGELSMLTGTFNGKKNAFCYLQEAVEICGEINDEYRRQNAMQCYLNALYFSGHYDNSDKSQQTLRKEYEQYLEESTKKAGQLFPSVIGRLRIVQGDVQFSKYFQRQPKGEEAEEYFVYRRKEDKDDIRPIRNMLRCYVEACEFMAQMSGTSIYFAAAVRVLQRRIELIEDRFALEEIQEGFPHIWEQQPNLKKHREELEMLMRFAAIRSVLVKDEDNDNE